MHYGFKYNFGNIVASPPPFHIGSYAEADWRYILKHMTSGLPVLSEILRERLTA